VAVDELLSKCKSDQIKLLLTELSIAVAGWGKVKAEILSLKSLVETDEPVIELNILPVKV